MSELFLNPAQATGVLSAFSMLVAVSSTGTASCQLHVGDYSVSLAFSGRVNVFNRLVIAPHQGYENLRAFHDAYFAPHTESTS